MREFSTGATRDTDTGKPDYEGFLSPLVIERFGEYMHGHRRQADGKLRDSDNWQKGIPIDAYMKSAWRHFFDVWKAHRGLPAPPLAESLCALLFNVQGYLHEHLRSAPSEVKALPERAGPFPQIGDCVRGTDRDESCVGIYAGTDEFGYHLVARPDRDDGGGPGGEWRLFSDATFHPYP